MSFLKQIWIFILVLAFALLLGLFMGLVYAGPQGNIAIIPVHGELVVSSGTGILLSQTRSDDIISLIEKADQDPGIEAIVLSISSPGGSPVASNEIKTAVMNSSKPVFAWIREMGASGAYWISSASDHIIANELSMVGSIGALMYYLEYSELMQKYGVDYVNIVSGEEKDMMSPYRNATEDELILMQGMVDEVSDYFINDVKQLRNLTNEEVANISNGRIMLAKEALSLGLIDEIGGKDELKQTIMNKTNISMIDFVKYESGVTAFDLFNLLTSLNPFTQNSEIKNLRT